jgi:hypothetical protein
MPLYTWLMARSSDEIPVDPEIRLDGWKLSFPKRPQIPPKELREDQSTREMTGSSSETWTPGEPISIERRFHINHTRFLERTGLPKGTRIRLGVKWRVDSRSAAGFEGRLVTLDPNVGETEEIVSTTMDGSKLGGIVLVSTPITLDWTPPEAARKGLAAKEHGQILWRGLDRSKEENPLEIALQGEGSRFPIRCVNRVREPYSYWVEWSHTPQGSTNFETMRDFLARDPRTVFRVVVNTATSMGKSLLGDTEQELDLVRRCWAHEIAGMIAQRLFHICQKLDDHADQMFSSEFLVGKHRSGGAVNMGNILTGFIEVMNPGAITGGGGCPSLKALAEKYFGAPEEFVKAWQSKISTRAARS